MIKVDTLLETSEILITRLKSPHEYETINIKFKNVIDEQKVERLIELFNSKEYSNKTVQHHPV